MVFELSINQSYQKAEKRKRKNPELVAALLIGERETETGRKVSR